MSWPPKNDIGFVVRRIFEEKRSGVIRALHPPVQRSLYFDDGRFVFAHSNVKREKLGALLVKYEILESMEELEQMIKIKGQMRLGEFLMNQGIIAPDELQRILDEQMRFIFSQAFYSSTQLQWIEKEQPIYRDLELPIELPRVLEDTILNDTHPERYLRKIPPEDYWLVITEKSVFERPHLQSEDNLILSMLTRARQVKDLLAEPALSREETARRLYLGLLFGNFDARPPESFQGAAKDLYSLTNPQLNALPPEWEQFAEKIDTMKPHEAFALPSDAPLSQVNKRYRELCDWLHPIYYNPDLDAEAKRRVKHLIDRISEYYDMLKTRALAKKVDHLKVVARKPPGQPPTPDQILTRIRHEIARGQFNRAADLLKKHGPALQNRAEYYLLSGIVLSQQRETWKQAESAFKRALEMDPENIDFLLEFAGFYNLIGLKIKAFHLLRKVLALDPNHFRARELLRLYQKEGEAPS